MNRALNVINFVGVLALAALCVVQWQVNRRANLETASLEKMRGLQTARLEEQDKSLKGLAGDLDGFRAQLTRANRALKETETKLALTDRQVRQLTAERDQLKVRVTNWAAAVAIRDTRLQEANERIQFLGKELNTAVGKFNALATNYNDVVRQLNESRARAGHPGPAPALSSAQGE